MNVCLYARVSSDKQAEKDLSLPSQLKTLREYAQKRGWTIVEEFVDEAEVSIVQDIFAMSLKGEGQKDIAKTLNRKGIFKRTGKPWTNSTIGYILNNPVYTGNLYWQEARHNPQTEKPGITVPNTHPAIIPEHVFKQTRKKIHGRTRQVINPRVLASKHLLSGLLKCKKCGALMTPLGTKSGKFHYYTCQTYLKIEYTVPVLSKIKDRTSTKEVLFLKQNGVAG